ncbi:protein SHORT ROOT IN SALT MEDIUM 1-like [Zingiber officinale]|uniref:protein SHORT ROOT IN SALT MEDIUM 1-like n=1 Tax=Zingiber officinale TaxID=94328 RepID=UPI001C4C5693|nr:protein SHORT ROOT IN SALT MEDIUM 1-like [Zingiber officinale]
MGEVHENCSEPYQNKALAISWIDNQWKRYFHWNQIIFSSNFLGIRWNVMWMGPFIHKTLGTSPNLSQRLLPNPDKIKRCADSYFISIGVLKIQSRIQRNEQDPEEYEEDSEDPEEDSEGPIDPEEDPEESEEDSDYWGPEDPEQDPEESKEDSEDPEEDSEGPVDLEEDPEESEEDSKDPEESEENLGECVEDPIENLEAVLPEITPNDLGSP